MKKVFVVILNFNGFEDTIACVKSLQKMEKNETLEIVVIDNASNNESVEEINKALSGIVFLRNKENLGFSGGCNVGMRYAMDNGADFIMLLNNDTLVDKNLLDNLLNTFGQSENIGGVVPKIYFAKGHEFHKDKYKKNELGKVIWYAGGKMDWKNLIGENIGVDQVDHGQFDVEAETELATGCCFLIKTEALKKVGVFDERYYLYYEDADLTQRMKKAGMRVVYNPKGIVWHLNAGSGGGSGSTLQDYYITRNRLLFGSAYASIRTKIALLRESLKIFKEGRQWQKKGVVDFYLGRFGKGSFPI